MFGNYFLLFTIYVLFSLLSISIMGIFDNTPLIPTSSVKNLGDVEEGLHLHRENCRTLLASVCVGSHPTPNSHLILQIVVCLQQRPHPGKPFQLAGKPHCTWRLIPDGMHLWDLLKIQRPWRRFQQMLWNLSDHGGGR